MARAQGVQNERQNLPCKRTYWSPTLRAYTALQSLLTGGCPIKHRVLNCFAALVEGDAQSRTNLITQHRILLWSYFFLVSIACVKVVIGWNTSLRNTSLLLSQAQGIQNERLCLPSKRTSCSPTYLVGSTQKHFTKISFVYT